ncbi:hypothetical protein F0242_00180 [Vibrio rotiferianus]|nr:hypothetical protein BSZ04_22925 [Vibrio rotiferianus]NOH65064.1 hypothetical protein [Vibrio rotiferianus]TMX70978.1 hypothetical protein DA097_04380 [Vibrio rotiferianus]
MNNSFCVLALYLPIRICIEIGELNAQASQQHGWGDLRSLSRCSNDQIGQRVLTLSLSLVMPKSGFALYWSGAIPLRFNLFTHTKYG